ncbi:MAG TPA: glycoside hydrolase family 3 C-terminal domain-containing protein [Candidatus Sulfotelmatobacter sp.]|nr:glycoside hydrolase family 3 C-terminal domain-containing protein [Candidatus Sulfotelmatobacter sp.]
MLRKVQSFCLLFFLFALPAVGQTAPASQAATEARVDSMLKQLNLEEKIDLLGGVDSFYIRAIPRIGLPRLKMADGPLGVRNYGPSTAFGGIGLAATWDPTLAQRIGAVIGQDARARGVHFMLGPGVNIYRAPLCGRNFEYFGEDPFLSSRTAVAYIEGMQSQGVSATVKHFIGNNQEYDRHNMDSIIDERTMREIYLPVFEAAVKEAHVGAVMDSYNLTNGQHMTQNGYLNTEVAKKDWGFTGIMMSDWDSTYDAVAAANGGLDLEMPSGKSMNRATLLPAVKAGKVSEATIDDKVRRILRTAINFGWLDRDQTDLSISKLNPEGHQVTLEAARAGMVLLKNDGNLLPLEKGKIHSIAVIGPDAYPAVPGGGGSAEAKPFTPISYLEGVANYLGSGAKVYYERGLPAFDEIAKHTEFTTEATGGQPGLKAEFFTNATLSGAPAVTRTDKHVNYEPARGSDGAASDMSIRWSGYFSPPAPGDYLVFVQGPGENGGYRLYVDKKLIFDNWKDWYAFVSEVSLNFTPGPHQIELDYYAHSGWGKTPVNLGIARPDTLVTPEAKAVASRVDAVVLAVGFDPSTEGESGDRTFRLPPGQDELINQITAANKNTIVVVTSGGGVDMTSWVDHVPALFEAWYPGQEGGTALAQLLFGEFDPTGRLPISMERRWQDNAVHDSYYPKDGEKKVEYTEGIFVGYRHFDKSGIKPLFPFGYGLSYTTFAYKNLAVSPAASSENATVAFDVTNTGTRAGAEVAQVYVGDRHANVPRPVKELKGFARVELNPGETKHVEVTLNRRAFSYYDVKGHQWTVAPGDFDIYVARSAAEIELTGKLALQ